MDLHLFRDREITSPPTGARRTISPLLSVGTAARPGEAYPIEWHVRHVCDGCCYLSMRRCSEWSCHPWTQYVGARRGGRGGRWVWHDGYRYQDDWYLIAWLTATVEEWIEGGACRGVCQEVQP